MTAIISCSGVSKTFRIPQREYHSLRGRILHPLTRPTIREFVALDNVSFDVARGEFFGIIGRNGSGKSTLLKTIAGIYRPDAGGVDVRGTLASFIELGVGFNDELSGHDNLLINGALLGLSRREIRRRYDEIVDFAELDGFMDLKLRNFSSGMQVRLAFSIALQAEVEILLTDEVLAVGDARFQEKCFDVFRRRKAEGRTMVFVSHDMSAVQQFCDRAMLIDDSKVVSVGNTHQIARQYLQVNSVSPDHLKRHASTEETSEVSEEVGFEFVGAWMEDANGEQIGSVGEGEQIRFRVRVRSRFGEGEPMVGMAISDAFGQALFATDTKMCSVGFADMTQGEERDVLFEVTNYLAHGSYTISCTLYTWDPGWEPGDVIQHQPTAWHMWSTSNIRRHGIVDLPTVATTSAVETASALG